MSNIKMSKSLNTLHKIVYGLILNQQMLYNSDLQRGLEFYYIQPCLTGVRDSLSSMPFKIIYLYTVYWHVYKENEIWRKLSIARIDNFKRYVFFAKQSEAGILSEIEKKSP